MYCNGKLLKQFFFVCLFLKCVPISSGLVIISRMCLRPTECLGALFKAQLEAAADAGQGLRSEGLPLLQRIQF